MTITMLLGAAIILLDFTTSRLMPRRSPQVLVIGNTELPAGHICLVFPGFSNPAVEFAKGMPSVLGHDKLIVVVDYGTAMDDDLIYQTVWEFLEGHVGPAPEITLYGHSMGGQVGIRFRQRYLREGAKFGPIRTTVLDCSPMRPNSLQTPVPAFLARLLMMLIWPGVLLSGVIALGNLLTRKRMPVRLDEAADLQLYARYSRGIALFNPRTWRAQLLYMLGFKPSSIEADDDTEVYYIHSVEPQLDKLVRQLRAIAQWREKFPNMVMVAAKVSHAWPLERPATYAHWFRQIWHVPRG